MIFIETNIIYNEDCLGDKEKGTGMWRIKDKSIDMILCDLPYGTTACRWDVIIPFELLWKHYERVIKDNGAIVLFGNQPFTSQLINSNLKLYRYEIIWEKDKGTDVLNANRKPLKSHENIEIFYKKLPTYNPQFTYSTPYIKKQRECGFGEVTQDQVIKPTDKECLDGRRYPKTIIKIPREMHRNKKYSHPTAKPVALCEWLIKTYTNKGEIVLDNCMGGGATAIACINTDRKYIGFELEKDYVEIANKRIK